MGDWIMGVMGFTGDLGLLPGFDGLPARVLSCKSQTSCQVRNLVMILVLKINKLVNDRFIALVVSQKL